MEAIEVLRITWSDAGGGGAERTEGGVDEGEGERADDFDLPNATAFHRLFFGGTRGGVSSIEVASSPAE